MKNNKQILERGSGSYTGKNFAARSRMGKIVSLSSILLQSLLKRHKFMTDFIQMNTTLLLEEHR